MQPASEKLKIVINAGSNGLSFAATIAVTFFVQPILVHGLGDERFGIWLLVNSILAYMAIGDLGIGAAVLRYVARFDGLQDNESINRVFNTSFSLFGGIGLLLLAVTCFLAFAWSCPLGVEPHLAFDTRWLLALLGVNLAFGFPLSLYRVVLESLGRYPTLNAIRIVGLLIRNALFVTIIHTGGGLVAIGAAITVCSLTQNATYAFFARRHLPTLKLSTGYVDLASFRMIWGYSAQIFIGQSAWRMAEAANPFIINLFLGPGAITFYGIAATMYSNASGALGNMIQVITPAVSRWEGSGDFSAIRRLLMISTRYVVYLGMPIQLGLICFGHPFLTLWMGPRYAEFSYPILLILALSLPLGLTNVVAGRILLGIGRVKVLSAISVVQSLVSVTLAVAMATVWGIEGVAAAITLVNGLGSLAVSVLVCRITSTSLAAFLARAYLKPVLLSATVVPLWLVGQWVLPPTSWSHLILVGLVGLLAYGAIALLADRGLRENGAGLLAGLRRQRNRWRQGRRIAVAHTEREGP